MCILCLGYPMMKLQQLKTSLSRETTVDFAGIAGDALRQ
jgi:hypothetical protein